MPRKSAMDKWLESHDDQKDKILDAILATGVDSITLLAYLVSATSVSKLHMIYKSMPKQYPKVARASSRVLDNGMTEVRYTLPN